MRRNVARIMAPCFSTVSRHLQQTRNIKQTKENIDGRRQNSLKHRKVGPRSGILASQSKRKGIRTHFFIPKIVSLFYDGTGLLLVTMKARIWKLCSETLRHCDHPHKTPLDVQKAVGSGTCSIRRGRVAHCTRWDDKDDEHTGDNFSAGTTWMMSAEPEHCGKAFRL